MFKKLVSLLLVIVMLLSLVGCGDSYMDAYIYFELEYIPSTLDPQLVSTREEYTIVRSIFDTLLRYNDEGTLRPSAASSFEKNGLTYKFTISEDASWKNGDKLTAYDFEYAFKRALDPETAAPAAATLSSVQSAVAENENTFVVTLSYDDPDFLNTLTLPVTMPCTISENGKTRTNSSSVSQNSSIIRVNSKQEACAFITRLTSATILKC